MSDETRYRKQAKMCRDMASVASDEEAAKHWLVIADEFEGLADHAARVANKKSPPPQLN